MSAFSSKTFNSSDYAKFRPSYEASLFDFIDEYHKGDHNLAVDVGCGPGEASYPLAKQYGHVIGTDLSHTMIDTANEKITPELRSKLEFRQSPAEELPFLQDSSVDLVTAAQCVHWLQHSKFFKEVERVLKPQGTLAIWGYADPVFNDPVADEMAEQFTYSDPDKLGPHWEQPGRGILRDLLRTVVPPEESFTDLQTYERTENEPSPLVIQREMPFEEYGQYIKTSSSYHTWKAVNGDKPDIADAFLQQLQAKKQWTPKTMVKLQWMTVLKLARRR